MVLANLSYLAGHRGDFIEARELDRAALRLSWDQGRLLIASWFVTQLTGPEFGLGHRERAAQLIGAGDAAQRMLGAGLQLGDVPEHERVVDALRDGLGNAAFDRLHFEGARLSLQEAVDLALSLDEVDVTVDDVRHH